MKDLFLVNYSVKGIKSLENTVSLSFYKKTISKQLEAQEYNVKGIYGMNGSGKTAIISSVDILKNIITNPSYLSNPIVQKHLESIINKKLEKLTIEVDYLSGTSDTLMYFRYHVELSKDLTGKFVISEEELLSKRATSRADTFVTIFRIIDGEVKSIFAQEDHKFSSTMVQKTVNLLSTSSMGALFFDKILANDNTMGQDQNPMLYVALCVLFIFGKKLHVYMEQSDDHREYFVRNLFNVSDDVEKAYSKADALASAIFDLDTEMVNTISVYKNYVLKEEYDRFEDMVKQLYEFLQIFKSELRGIEIDRREDKELYICELVLLYDGYKIHAEFESTGIKKLIKLFSYLREMVQGGIVFIDEFDSNLHDVYLCALLEYLMEYGRGQLCFTTHNVGPMDVLKRNKKSIDFLSEDNQIYPWTTNGNYSPSKLYRNGMIEGSPFNVDSIDFIGAFHTEEE